MISGVVTSFGLPDHSASFVLLRPRLNSPIHFLTICLDGEDSLITFIKPLFCLDGVIPYKETVFNQHTKFTFSNFNKKIETCSLLSSVTLKVNNEIGSNFDSCCLEDCTSWEEYENVIYGAISVSSYELIKLPNTECS